jgi:Golgi SNAP receptor complex protein 1
MTTENWDHLRKQARKLENEIDLKLVALSKISCGASSSGSSSPDTTPLLNTEHVYETLSLEIGKN